MESKKNVTFFLVLGAWFFVLSSWRFFNHELRQLFKQLNLGHAFFNTADDKIEIFLLIDKIRMIAVDNKQTVFVTGNPIIV